MSAFIEGKDIQMGFEYKKGLGILDSCHHGRSHGWTWGQWPPQIFLKKIYYYIMGTNFSNFVL